MKQQNTFFQNMTKNNKSNIHLNNFCRYKDKRNEYLKTLTEGYQINLDHKAQKRAKSQSSKQLVDNGQQIKDLKKINSYLKYCSQSNVINNHRYQKLLSKKSYMNYIQKMQRRMILEKSIRLSLGQMESVSKIFSKTLNQVREKQQEINEGSIAKAKISF